VRIGGHGPSLGYGANHGKPAKFSRFYFSRPAA
jgi:hypothetical protein